MDSLEIDVHQLKTRLDAGEDLQLLDVREAWEIAIARLQGAVVIPMMELARRLQELDDKKPTVVYCHHGIRTLHVALALRSRGFADVRSVRGGIDRWSLEIDPALPRY